MWRASAEVRHMYFARVSRRARPGHFSCGRLCVPHHTVWRFTEKTRFSRSPWAGRRCAVTSRFPFIKSQTLQGLPAQILQNNFHRQDKEAVYAPLASGVGSLVSPALLPVNARWEGMGSLGWGAWGGRMTRTPFLASRRKGWALPRRSPSLPVPARAALPAPNKNPGANAQVRAGEGIRSFVGLPAPVG